MTTVRTRIGAVTAPLAPVALTGAEYAARKAMGSDAKYWRAFAKSFVGSTVEDFQWRSRIGDIPLRPAGSGFPDFVDGPVPYFAFGAGKSLISPAGVVILPQTPHMVSTLVYIPPSGGGVILGNRAEMTIASNSANVNWEGLITGILGDADDLAFCSRGQPNRITAPDTVDYKDNSWHVVSGLYRGTATPSALRVDGAQIATGTITSPLAAPQYREMRVGAAGVDGPSATDQFIGRIGAICIVPREMGAAEEAANLRTIEAYLGSLAGISVP